MTEAEAKDLMRKRRNAYYAKYRREHPEKTREKNRRYVEKLARRLAAGEEIKGAVYGGESNGTCENA